MLIAILVAMLVAGLYAIIRCVAFLRKSAVARHLRELVWNERLRAETDWEIPFLVIVDAWCKKEMSSLFEEGTQHACLSAQIYDGRHLTMHVYYRPGDRERPYHLEVSFFTAGSKDSCTKWSAREGQVLRGDERMFFSSEECLALNALDAFAQEQGFSGLKPLQQSA
jgi:hypothetical protein